MTLKQFFSKPNTKTVVVKKPKGKKHYLFWWETGFDCFVNKQFTTSMVPNSKTSSFICKRDLPNYLDLLTRDGYEVVDEIKTKLKLEK